MGSLHSSADPLRRGLDPCFLGSVDGCAGFGDRRLGPRRLRDRPAGDQASVIRSSGPAWITGAMALAGNNGVGPAPSDTSSTSPGLCRRPSC